MNTDQVAVLAAEYLDLKERAQHLDDRIKQIVAELRDLGEGSHVAGAYKVQVGATPHRFNAERAAEILATNPALLDACRETVVTSTRARAVLPPAVYAACSLPAGEARVNVRPA